MPSTTESIAALLHQHPTNPLGVRDLLIEHSSSRLYRLARRMLQDYPRVRRYEDTDDVLQNAVIRLRRSLAAVKPATVREFFGLAALNIRRELLDLVRKHTGPRGVAANHASPVSENNNTLLEGQNRVEQPRDILAWNEFHEAIHELDDPLREVFTLRWYEGLKVREIAQLLDLSEPTVKRRWRAACLKLHELCEGYSPLDA
tara:strand:- start:304 stop:909 length:606 start_codon:yes stop_codon:yes gene_type:complete